jgi:hypothetical protein
MITLHFSVRLMILTALAVGVLPPVCAKPYHQQTRHAVAQKPLRKFHILVNKHNNTLRLYISGQPMRRYRVATGLYKCTPEGNFRVIEKSIISKKGRGPLGTRWLGLNTLGKRGWKRVGIHGTNEPQTIGHHASKACVRMLNTQVNEMYSLVPIGTTVRIVDIRERPYVVKRPAVINLPVAPFLYRPVTGRQSPVKPYMFYSDDLSLGLSRSYARGIHSKVNLPSLLHLPWQLQPSVVQINPYFQPDWPAIRKKLPQSGIQNFQTKVKQAAPVHLLFRAMGVGNSSSLTSSSRPTIQP